MKLLASLLFTFILFVIDAQTNILMTDFQGGIPNNYTLLNIDGAQPNAQVLDFASGWIAIPDPENPTDTVAGASSYFISADTSNRWLITPALQLGSFGNFISWEAKSHDPSYPDDYLVLVSKTSNDPSSFTDTIGSVQEENFEWTFREVDLSAAGYNDSTIYVAFVLRTFDGFKLYLDDIQVRKDDPVGMNENILNLVLYPNPASQFLSVQLEGFLKATVYNLDGQVLIHSTTEHIDLSTLHAGSYYIQCQSEFGTLTKRFVKL